MQRKPRHALRSCRRDLIAPLCRPLADALVRCAGSPPPVTRLPTKALDTARESLGAAFGPVDAATPEAETGVETAGGRVDLADCDPRQPLSRGRAGDLVRRDIVEKA